MPHPWPVMPSSLSLNILDSNAKGPTHGGDTSFQARGNLRFSAFGEYPALHGESFVMVVHLEAINICFLL